jgi:RNA-directed DNA polymerase
MVARLLPCKPRQKSVQKLRDSLRVKTRRNSGRSLDRIIAEVNRTLRGWFAYFQHSTCKSDYRGLDGWLRRRLRSLLRRRHGSSGHGHTARDCFTWPNRFFAAHGLYSLATAHAAACQSSLR